MKAKFFKPAIALALLASAAVTLEAQTTTEWIHLAATRSSDIAATEVLRADAQRSLPGVSHEPVAFTYALPADQQALQAPAAFVAESREYWMEVGGKDLRGGVTLSTTVPGALVRINPAGRAQLAGRASALALDPAALEIRAGGKSFAAGTGMELLASAEALQQSGAPFLEGTTAFRLAPQVGAGSLVLAAPLANEAERYVVHVFEPKSAQKLTLKTDRADYLHGQSLVVEASLGDGQTRVAFDQVEAFVSAPSGRAFPLKVARQQDGSYRGKLVLDGREALPQGLWEVNLVAKGRANGLTLVRGARTAFACALPTAALEGRAGLTRGDRSLRLELPLAVGTPGRYEVRGTLYGLNAKGELAPLMVAHFANWLEAGRGSLSLNFENIGADLKGPFEVRDLRLIDQSRMGILHRQDQALVLP